MDQDLFEQCNLLDVGYQNNDKKLNKNDCLSTRPGMAVVLTDLVSEFLAGCQASK